MKHILIIPGRLPGMNEYASAQRHNRYKGAALKREAQAKVGMCIRAQLYGLQIKQPVRLEYSFVEQNRKRDLDNISGFAHKVIQDALVEHLVIPDDGWRYINGYSDSFSVDPSKPHITVTIVTEDE